MQAEGIRHSAFLGKEIKKVTVKSKGYTITNYALKFFLLNFLTTIYLSPQPTKVYKLKIIYWYSRE